MATTSVEICNIALSYLGKDTISSLTSDTETAAACNLYYQPTVDEMLSDREWHFAITRVALAQISITNLSNYDYAYQIPNDCLRILQVYERDDSRNSKVEYRREGDYIFTNEDAAYLEYVRSITDPNEFPWYFIEALAFKLAARMAIRLTSKRAFLQDMTAFYSDAYRRAEAADAMESREHPDPDTMWTEEW